MAYQIETDLLLLFTVPDIGVGASDVMTGKVFEYFGAKRPIFALVPNGPLKNLIEEGNFGIVVPPNDSHAIADGFEAIYQEWKNNGKLSYSPNDTVRERYTIKNLTQQLASVIKKVV